VHSFHNFDFQLISIFSAWADSPTVKQCVIPGPKAQIIFKNLKLGAGGRKSEVCPDISHFFRLLSLTPGFSPVEKGEDGHSRFNGFPQCVKAAEAAPGSLCPQDTGLKPSVNETAVKFAGQKPKERTRVARIPPIQM
jgi:hypothetical protein